MNNAEKVKHLMDALKCIANEASKSKPSKLRIKEIVMEAIDTVERQ